MSMKKAKRAEAKKRKFDALMRVAEMNEVQAKRKKLCDVDSVAEATKEASTSESDDVRAKLSKNGITSRESVKRLTPDELMALRARLRLRQKMAMQSPKLFLTLNKMAADLDWRIPRLFPSTNSSASQPQLFVSDLQHLLLNAVQGNLVSYKPRWCTLIRAAKISRVALLVVEGVSSVDYQLHVDSFPFIAHKFTMSVEMVNPLQFGETVAEQLFKVPLSMRQLKKVDGVSDGDKNSSCEKSLHSKDQTPLPSKDCVLQDGEVISRFDLLLNTEQMILEDYPMPVSHAERTRDYVFSKAEYKEVSDSSAMFGLDCEMGNITRTSVDRYGPLAALSADVAAAENPLEPLVDLSLPPVTVGASDWLGGNSCGSECVVCLERPADSALYTCGHMCMCCTCAQGLCQTCTGRNELTRVAITREDGRCILDALVKPTNNITNYLTKFSGITKKMLEKVTTRIETVQQQIRALLPPDAILVGQSLNGDLHALKMFHPYVIDTSLIYNITGIRTRRTKLKTLTSMFLNREIQTGGKMGHSPSEDALAALQLVQLKLRKGLKFGDVILGGPLNMNTEVLQGGPLNVNTEVLQGGPLHMNTVVLQGGPLKMNTEVPQTVKTNSLDSLTAAPLENLEPELNASENICKGTSDNESPPTSEFLSGPHRRFLSQKKLFFACAAAKMLYTDFFKLVRKENKSAAVGGFGDGLSSYLCTTRLEGETDGQLADQCRDVLTKNFIVCARFTSASNKVPQVDRQSALQLVDGYVEKVLTSLDPGALTVVLLSGDQEQYHNAMCFVAIT